MWATWCAASILAALAATEVPAAPVAGPPPELELTWQAPAGCPSPTDVQTQFVRLLGGASRTPSGKHIAATATVHVAGPGRWVLELATVLDGAGGKRSLPSDSCASVASAAALILALMIDPAAAERAATDAEPPPTPPKKPAPAPTVVAAPPEPEVELEPFARAAVGVVFRLLPEPTLAGALALGARRGPFAGELTLLATMADRTDAAQRANAGGDFRLLAGGVHGCGAVGTRVVWQLCLGGELERLSATGFGIAQPNRPGATMLAGTGDLVILVPLGAHVAVTLQVGGAARPYRPSFVFMPDPTGAPAPTERVFTVPLVSGVAVGGFAVNL